MAPLRLAGVMIWTTADRYESMRYFYVETLGLRPRSDRERFVNFEWDSVRLTIGSTPMFEAPRPTPCG
jgi:hypothetical protein